MVGQSRLLGGQHAAQNRQNQLHVLREEGLVLRSQTACQEAYRRLLLDVCTFHGAGEWAFTQSMFQGLRIWSRALPATETKGVLGRAHENYWCRCGSAVEKAQPPRLQTLTMRGVHIAAWQMVSCPSDAKNRRYWEESVTRRFDEMWRDEYIKLSKEDYRNSTQWKRPIPGRPNYWERPFTRFLGDAWTPKLKACNTRTEWFSVTKELEHSRHVYVGLEAS